MSTTAPVTTPFGFETTAAEVVEGVDLTGKRAVVTGGASGIGIETARALARAGADVTLAVRNVHAGEEVAREIAASAGGREVHVGHLDLADRSTIAAFTARWDGPLHILVNNAGVMALPERTLTAEGWEAQFATNHLGHFALARGLHRALAEAEGARIVSVSSSGHLRSPVIFDDLHFGFREYTPWLAYGQSKTANVLFAVGAAERWADDGIVANALMPGGIFTNLQRHLPQEVIDGWKSSPALKMKTPEQGAATSVLLAASPLVDGATGEYWEDCNPARLVPERPETGAGGVAPYALDRANADRLWELSLRLVG